MATSVTQNPASIVKIAYGAFSFTGYCPETIDEEGVGEVEHVFCDGSLLTSLTRNVGTRISGTLIVLDAGSLSAPVAGSIITLTPPSGTSSKWIAMPGCKVASSGSAARLSLTCEKYVGATYV